jgi:hypothetical protein
MRKIIIINIIFILTIITGCSAPEVFDSVTSSNYEIDTSKEIFLDFKDANIKVASWDNNFIEVTYDSAMKGKKKIDIENENNTLTLISDVKEGIRIKIPNVSVNIKAGIIEAKDCTLKEIEANKTVLRYCKTAENFYSQGGSIEIRESKMRSNAVIKNSIVRLRECDIENISLESENDDKKIDAQLREIRGIEVNIVAKSYNSLSVEIKDPKLQKLVIESDSDKGDITVISGSIDKVDNNSGIEIKKEKNPIIK